MPLINTAWNNSPKLELCNFPEIAETVLQTNVQDDYPTSSQLEV